MKIPFVSREFKPREHVKCLTCCIVSNPELEILDEIPDEELTKFKELFRKNWPFSLHAYYWIDNYIKWKIEEITNIKFFRPEGEWNDGTFISIDESQSSFQIFVFTLDKTHKKLRKLLQKSEKINWTHTNLIFVAVHEEFQPIISEELGKRNLKTKQYGVSFMWWLPRLLALSYKFELPKDLYLAPLNPNDANIITSIRTQSTDREPLTVQDIRQLISSNGGFGLYLKDNNQLCSWIIRDNYGSVSMLQTMDKFTRLGYATILVKHFSKFWSLRGYDTFCFPKVDNIEACHLFRKLGFRKTHKVIWIQVKNK